MGIAYNNKYCFGVGRESRVVQLNTVWNLDDLFWFSVNPFSDGLEFMSFLACSSLLLFLIALAL